MKIWVVFSLAIAAISVSSSVWAMTPASYCPGLLTGKYHFGVTTFNIAGESDGDDIIVIRNEDSVVNEGDKPEISERIEIDERDFPQTQITPIEETPSKDKGMPLPPVPPNGEITPPKPKDETPLKN